MQHASNIFAEPSQGAHAFLNCFSSPLPFGSVHPADTNGDGMVTLKEFEDNLHEKTRQKIVDKLDSGWTFDAAKWEESQARHAGDEAFDASKATLQSGEAPAEPAAEAAAEPAAEAPPAEPAAE